MMRAGNLRREMRARTSTGAATQFGVTFHPVPCLRAGESGTFRRAKFA